MVDVSGNVLRVLQAGADVGHAPIVLAADAPVVLEHLVPQVEALRGQRRVIALERPGFGLSRPRREYRFTLPAQVEVLLDGCQAPLAFTCVNALVAAALAKRAPERVERLTRGPLPSVEEHRRWAARIALKVSGVLLLATPGVGQALMAAAPSFIADKWFHGVSGTYARVAQRVYRAGGTFCLAALNQSLNDVTATDIGPLSTPTTFLWGAADRSHRATNRDSCREIVPGAEVRSFDDLGHCFDLEDPERVASILLAPSSLATVARLRPRRPPGRRRSARRHAAPRRRAARRGSADRSWRSGRARTPDRCGRRPRAPARADRRANSAAPRR
jgi:pimeloyl-ACP methyl ester carboxylesterase